MDSCMIFKPIVFATAIADAPIGTICAFLGFLCSESQKIYGNCTVDHLLEVCLVKRSDFPTVQCIEVAGVPGTVAFNHKIRSALSTSGTGTGSITKQYVHIILEKPHAVVVSSNPVLISQIECATQEFAICVRCKRPRFTTAFMSNRIQTGNKLNIPESQLL